MDGGCYCSLYEGLATLQLSTIYITMYKHHFNPLLFPYDTQKTGRKWIPTFSDCIVTISNLRIETGIR